MRSKNAKLNILTNLILNLVVIIYGFIVPKIIINNFGSSVNGLVSSITQFLAYITLLESGFGPIVKSILYKPIAENDKSKICSILKSTEKFFKRISYIFIIYIIILCFMFPLFINNTFKAFYTASLILIISISVFAEYFFGMTYRLYLQADQKTYIISIIQIFTYILSIIAILVLAHLGCSIHILKFISALIFVLRPILQNIYVRMHYKIDFNNYDEKYVIKNKWDGLAQHVASVIHDNTDITVLTIFCNLLEVSVYSVYYLVVKGLKSLIQSFAGGIDSIFGDMIAKKENNNLRKKFSMYEIGYFTICTILFSSAMLLIVPFVSIYTKGVTDVNYVRPLFGYLIVISEFIWAIRLPYISITYAAGHFKETRLGAWVECICNIIISMLLVSKYGIVGVAIGTIIAMAIRTTEFVIHSNKYILNRSIFASIKIIALLIIETLFSVIICNIIQNFEIVGILSWILNAIITVTISSIVTILINYIFYRKQINDLFKIIINRRKKHE